ncbi:hypothetical protein NC653_005928 [Populus alba x Populus x berolinensis]|uniref:Uncharacterized protein n=1 Tax=Populus alba x Populus x berolinensis TaxID=444605 RepID=A0AAD6RD23_9ROSI|nr:hypothetical protein NC653_005928 [Populus alba x Populus x berolinensis]
MHLKPTATCFSDNFGSTSIRGQGFKVSWVVYMASWLAPNILDGKVVLIKSSCLMNQLLHVFGNGIF